MLNGTPTPISARRASRFLWLAIITVVLIPAFAAPSTSAPRSAAGPDITGDQAGRSSQWIARPPLRQARGGLGVAKVGRQILAISGFDRDNLFDVVEARRVTGIGRWRDLAPLPTARANLATAEVGGLVYAIGGIEAVGMDEFIDSNVVETFNPRSGRWATSLPLPQPRSGPGAAGLGGLLYVAGGFIPLTGDDFETTNSVLAYDPNRTPGDRSPQCLRLGSGSGWWRRAATCTPSAGLPPRAGLTRLSLVRPWPRWNATTPSPTDGPP